MPVRHFQMGLAFELVESVDCPLQCGWTHPVPWKSKQTKCRERRNLPPFSCLIEELGCLTPSSALGLRDLVHWLTWSQALRLGLNYTISFPQSSSSRKDGGVEKYALIFSCKNIKITTICWTTIDRRMLESTIMRNARLNESQAGIKEITGESRNQARRNIQQPQICRWYHSNGRKWRGTKELLNEGERRVKNLA